MKHLLYMFASIYIFHNSICHLHLSVAEKAIRLKVRDYVLAPLQRANLS